MYKALLTASMAAVSLVSLPSSALAAEWARTDKPDYGFSATFPSTPSEETGVENGVKSYTLSAGDGQSLCLVIRGEYPYVVNPEAELTASQSTFANAVHATVTTSKRTTFKRGSKTLQALEFDATRPSHDFRSILVVDGTYTYQVAGVVSKTDGNPDDLERCIRGFVLTP